jgi:hypothetical protein
MATQTQTRSTRRGFVPTIETAALANAPLTMPARDESRAPRTPASPRRRPTEVEVRQRAHEIWLARNGAPGNPLLDWLQAERELSVRTIADGGGAGCSTGFQSL